jgi:hypothetical protein
MVNAKLVFVLLAMAVVYEFVRATPVSVRLSFGGLGDVSEVGIILPGFQETFWAGS